MFDLRVQAALRGGVTARGQDPRLLRQRMGQRGGAFGLTGGVLGGLVVAPRRGVVADRTRQAPGQARRVVEQFGHVTPPRRRHAERPQARQRLQVSAQRREGGGRAEAVRQVADVVGVGHQQRQAVGFEVFGVGHQLGDGGVGCGRGALAGGRRGADAAGGAVDGQAGDDAFDDLIGGDLASAGHDLADPGLLYPGDRGDGAHTPAAGLQEREHLPEVARGQDLRQRHAAKRLVCPPFRIGDGQDRQHARSLLHNC
ncbi:hypothetical protein [Stackebrandtia nassauensis]|uniref:hypothetical protein n=1 Tax=Stackebrandtia nassauensis TaxID=283811 RepID=UPI001185A66B